jgi:hypothetical protein
MADENTKLLAEGKHEDWFNRRTESMKRESEKQLQNMAQQLEERDAKARKAEEKLQSYVLERELSRACHAADIKDEGPQQDALRLAKEAFTFDADQDRFVLKDRDGTIVYGSDGRTPKTMEEWLKEKQTSPLHRHWWPETRGTGANGSRVVGSDPNNPHAAYQATLQTGGYQAFRTARLKERAAN